MIWRPFFSPPTIIAASALLAALAVIASARSWRDRPRLSAASLAMRLALLGVLAAILFGPSEVPGRTLEPNRGRLTILLDTSASMQTEDVDGASRIGFAAERWLSPTRLAALAESFDVDVRGFDSEVAALNPAALERPEALATGTVSNVVRAIQDTVVAARPDVSGLSCVFIVSDGHDSLDESFQTAAVEASAQEVPVFAVCLGGAAERRDVTLVAESTQAYLLVGEEGQVRVRVIQAGAATERTRVELRSKRAGGDSVSSAEVDFAGRSSVVVEFPIEHDAPGVFEYEARVDPIAGEIETQNNAQHLFVDVSAERLEVLLVEGQPFWDTKFLAQSLRKDDRIALTQLTQVNRQRREHIVTRAAAPEGSLSSLDALASYDVVILGRAIENVLESELVELLPEYVGRKGGRLIFARGRPYASDWTLGAEAVNALALLEPVEWTDGQLTEQQIALEPSGVVHPVFAVAGGAGGVARQIAELPPLVSVPLVAREKVLAKVLARALPPGQATGGGSRGEGPPVVVTMEYERGVVALINAEGLWRWSLLPEDKQHLGKVFDRFWSNLVRWLALGNEFKPGENIALQLSRRSVQVGDTIAITVASRFRPIEELRLRTTITDPSGTVHGVALQPAGADTMRSRAEFKARTAGSYRVEVEAPGRLDERIEAKFSAYDQDIERLQCAARPLGLRLVAEQSGGMFLDPDDPDALLREIEKQRATSVVPPTPRYVWDEGALLAILLTWIGAEWLLRKRGGLL